MIRLVVLFLALFAIASAAAWYADHPGVVSVVWQGWRIEASLGLIAIVALFALILTVLIYRGLSWMLRGPGAVRDAIRERQQRQGFEALSKGLVAVAAGDAGEARRLARRTETLLDDPPLTLLLSAQAAQLEGDEDRARSQFEAMCDRPETEFLGLRGLLSHARRHGDDVAALGYAERAFEIRPDTPWVLRELFTLQCLAARWIDALATLGAATRRKAIARDEAARNKGSVLFMQARQAADAGEDRKASALAEQAGSAGAPLAPAAAMAARYRLAAGEHRRARKILRQAWAAQPHPLLVDTVLDYATQGKPDDPMAALAEFTSSAPEDRDNRLFRARAAIRFNDAEAAGDALKALAGDGADQEVCRLMADVCSDAGREADARGWLRRGLAAPAGPQWQCRSCGHDDKDWRPHCPRCRTFAGYEWTLDQTAIAETATAELLDAPDDAQAGDEPKAEIILPNGR